MICCYSCCCRKLLLLLWGTTAGAGPLPVFTHRAQAIGYSAVGCGRQTREDTQEWYTMLVASSPFCRICGGEELQDGDVPVV